MRCDYEYMPSTTRIVRSRARRARDRRKSWIFEPAFLGTLSGGFRCRRRSGRGHSTSRVLGRFRAPFALTRVASASPMPPPPSDALAAELARLARVAEARESAAAGASDDAAPYLAEVARRARAAHDVAARRAETLASETPPRECVARPVPRVHCASLSLAAFRREYGAARSPVVIEGLGPHLTEDGAEGADLRWLRRRGATKKVAVTRDNAHVSSTLSCADTDVLDLGTHLDRVLALEEEELRRNRSMSASPSPAAGTYLYDCAIPLKLPSLTQSVRVPRYFAHDFMQRTRLTHAFSASWPSLFVAAPGTRSSTHVDQWTGNFWMAMVRGVKRWTLFHADDVPLLSPDYGRGTLDPAFPRLHEMERERRAHFEGGLSEEGSDEANRSSEAEDVFDASDAEKLGFVGAAGEGPHPLAPLARRWDVDLGPGEVLFVPGGFPHVVTNLGVTVSFAGNYVDESNLDAALRDLDLLGAKYGEGMRATHTAIDEVWFDPEDEVLVEEPLEPKKMVVRYEDYRGGGAARWGAGDWGGCEEEEDDC